MQRSLKEIRAHYKVLNIRRKSASLTKTETVSLGKFGSFTMTIRVWKEGDQNYYRKQDSFVVDIRDSHTSLGSATEDDLETAKRKAKEDAIDTLEREARKKPIHTNTGSGRASPGLNPNWTGD